MDGRPGHWRVFRVGKGLQAEIPAGAGGLQVGDRILKIDGKGPNAGPPQRSGCVPQSSMHAGAESCVRALVYLHLPIG